jgi:hypothetical protein
MRYQRAELPLKLDALGGAGVFRRVLRTHLVFAGRNCVSFRKMGLI